MTTYLITGYNTNLPGATDKGKRMAQAYRNSRTSMLRELKLYEKSESINMIVIEIAKRRK